MKLLYLLGVLFVSITGAFGQNEEFQLLHGTSILIYIKTDSILVATDSRMGNVINGVNVGYNQMCKIKEFNNFIIAMAGVPTIIYDGDTLWSAYNEVVNELRIDTSIVTAYNVLYSKILGKLKEYYGAYIKVRPQAEVDSFFNVPRKMLLEVTMSGFNVRHKPVHANWLYYMDGDKTNWQIVPFQRYLINGDVYDPGASTVISMAGRQDSMTNYLKGPNQIHVLPKMSLKDAMQFLIKMEIAKDSSSVGLPVNVLLVTPKGHKWLTNYKVCKSAGGY